MAVVATGQNGLALEAVRDVLAQATDFQTMMDSVTDAAARAHCKLHSSRSQIPVPYCHIVIEDSNDNEGANRTSVRPMQVSADMKWDNEEVPGDSDDDVIMRAINRFDAMIVAVRAGIGTGTLLARADMALIVPKWSKGDNSQEFDGYMAGILFTWEI